MLAQETVSDENSPKYTVRALERGMAILTCFSMDKPELGITELSNILGLHKATVHRLLVTLTNNGMVEHNDRNGKYRLGIKLFELGSVVASQMDLRKRGLPILEELGARCGETVHLVVLDRDEAIYVEKVENPRALIRYSQVGKRLPLHCTAVGKVLLAGLPDQEMARIVETKGLPACTRRTIVSPERLYEEVEEVRAKGYALDAEELEEGLRCIAAPVREFGGRVVAAVSISGPSFRLSEAAVQNSLISMVKEASEKISRQLGWNAQTSSRTA